MASAAWSDQADAWCNVRNAGLTIDQLVVQGTGGPTLTEQVLPTLYEANDTGQTFEELVAFYNDANSNVA